MSKYTPLEQFLERSGKKEVHLTFHEIEEILERSLPASARDYAAWWSNNATGHVNAEAWLTAGYKASKVDLTNESLTFFRVKPAGPSLKGKAELKPRRHPMFGCMEGMITIPDNIDLTEPTDPEWGRIAEDMRLPE